MSLFSCLGILLVSDPQECCVKDLFQFGSVAIDTTRCVFAGQVDFRDKKGHTTSVVNVTHGKAPDGSDSDMPTPAFHGIEPKQALQLLNLLKDVLNGSIDPVAYSEQIAKVMMKKETFRLAPNNCNE